MTPVRVVVVDDHMVFREGLRALLARVPEIELVGEAATGEQAVSVVRETHPDVVLMDLGLPGDGGVAATKCVIAEERPPAVLVLTMYDDDQHLRSAMAAGARGYLLKDAAPDAIVRAVLTVNTGQVIFDEGMAARVIAATSAPAANRPFPALTDRELEILNKIARGRRNDSIAVSTGLSLKTVQNNASSILLKLGARDRAQLVALARDAGLGRSDELDDF